jgi:hypothetical protein
MSSRLIMTGVGKNGSNYFSSPCLFECFGAFGQRCSTCDDIVNQGNRFVPKEMALADPKCPFNISPTLSRIQIPLLLGMSDTDQVGRNRNLGQSQLFGQQIRLIKAALYPSPPMERNRNNDVNLFGSWPEE